MRKMKHLRRRQVLDKERMKTFMFLMHGSIWPVTIPPPSPGNPPGQIQPFGPGGRGWGKSKITSLPTSYFVKFMSFLAHFARWLPADLKTTHSQGKLQEFVRERLEWNNLSKFKPFLKVYFKFLLECAYNALIFFGKATKKYFFSLVQWYDKTT